MRLDAPEIQTLEDVRSTGGRVCRYQSARHECSPPSYGCVQVAGLKVARNVLVLQSEASEKTLSLEVGAFQARAPLPPDQVRAYVDTPEREYRRLSDPQLVVERVGEYARAVLGLKPAERVVRQPEGPMASSVEDGTKASQEKESTRPQTA